MVLLIVGKGLHASYSTGRFMTSLMNGYVKMAFAIGRAEPFCAYMAHKGVDAGSQVFGWPQWAASMPGSLLVSVEYIQCHLRRLKWCPGFGRGPGRHFFAI